MQENDEVEERSISRRALLAISYVVLISRYVIATFLSAFFSPLATQWGISPTLNGAIFASYPLGMALTSFFAPRVIAAIGTRSVVTGGLLLGSMLTIAFGLTPDIVSSSSPEQLGTLFLITYFLNGLFGALAETACIILLTTRFQDRLGAVMASVGSVCAVGCMVGPLVGGLLFDMTPEGLGPEWRFRMPFLVTALFGVLLAAPIHQLLPNQHLGASGPSGGGGSSASLFLAVLSPSVVLNLVAVALSGTAVATLDPTLPYRLSAPPFHFSATVVSTFLLGSSFVYILVSVPIGWLVDRFPGDGSLFKLTTGSGFFALALSFALLAPLRVPGAFEVLVQPLGLASSFWGLVVGMGLKGLGSALSNNAVYPDLVIGFPSDDEATQATISALWNAAYALGWALGPLVGGWLYDFLAVDFLCTGNDLDLYCTGDEEGERGNGCSCDWAPDNGFDGFGSVVAIACAAFGAVCCVAAVLRLPTGYRREPDLEPSSSSVKPILPKTSSALLEDEAIDELLSLLAQVRVGAPHYFPRRHTPDPDGNPNGVAAARNGSSTPPAAGLSKAPSHRSISRSTSIVTSVDAALERVGLGRFHLFTLPVLCLASMAQSLQTNVMSYLQPCAAETFSVPSGETGTLSGIVFAASAVATPCFGFLADAIGRKPATILSLVLMVCANLGSMLAPSFGWLCVWQGLAGVGLGGTMVPFDLLAEVSPPSVRGSVLNASNWMWSVGTIVVALTAAWSVEVTFADGWRILVGTVNAPLVITMLAAPMLVESPHWLMQRGKHTMAVAVLRSIADANGVVLPDPKRSPPAGGYMPPAIPVRCGGTDSANSLASSAVSRHSGSREGSALPQSNGTCAFTTTSSKNAIASAELVKSGNSIASVKSTNSVASNRSGGSSQSSLPDMPATVTIRNTNPITGSESLTSAQVWADLAASKRASPTPDMQSQALLSLMSSQELRSRALLHWAVWAVAGFGWTGLVFFATFVTTAEPSPVLPATDDNSPWRSLDEGGCSFDYTAQIIVVASEVPGTLLVQFVIDRPRGPFGLFGGRRGVQSLGYMTCGLLTVLMAQGSLIGATGVVVVSCLSRMLLAASNSAMWVAAPEQYPTKYRGFGANTAFLANVIGSVPAAALVYAPLPRWMVATGIGAANILAGCLALALPETAGIDLE